MRKLNYRDVTDSGNQRWLTLILLGSKRENFQNVAHIFSSRFHCFFFFSFLFFFQIGFLFSLLLLRSFSLISLCLKNEWNVFLFFCFVKKGFSLIPRRTGKNAVMFHFRSLTTLLKDIFFCFIIKKSKWKNFWKTSWLKYLRTGLL